MSTSEKRILYLGDDAAYFRVLGAEIRRLLGPVKIDQLFEKTPQRIQSLLPKIWTLKPSLIYVDFSKLNEEYVYLARLLVRTNIATPFAVIGLHDYLSPPEQMMESFLAGVSINHIKSAEVFDAAYSATTLLQGDAKEHGFAVADMELEATATHLCKVGYVDSQSIHFETDLVLANDSVLSIRNQWTNPKLIPSSLLKIRSSNTSLVFYNFKYGVDADFQWMDPLVIPEGATAERVAEMTADREHHVNKAKKAYKAWLDDNAERSLQKSVRVLVVDRGFSFYKDRERADKYGYAIRCQPFLADPVAEIEAQKPLVIAINIDGPEHEAAKDPSPLNDLPLVQKIANSCREKGGVLPYLVVFNLKEQSSKQLQQTLQYPQAMAFDGELSPEVLVKMAGLFSDKLKSEQQPPRDPATVFIKKASPMSIAEIEDKVTFVKLSESDAIISSKRALKAGSVLRFKSPLDGYLTVVSHSQVKPPQYYALVNGVGEVEKTALRREVNTQFFKDHDATKQTEMDEFQKLNDLKAQERAAEAAKVLAAAAEAAAAEASAVAAEEAKKAEDAAAAATTGDSKPESSS